MSRGPRLLICFALGGCASKAAGPAPPTLDARAPEPPSLAIDAPSLADAPVEAAGSPPADAAPGPDLLPSADGDRRATLLGLLRGIVNPTPPLAPKLDPPV